MTRHSYVSNSFSSDEQLKQEYESLSKLITPVHRCATMVNSCVARHPHKQCIAHTSSTQWYRRSWLTAACWVSCRLRQAIFIVDSDAMIVPTCADRPSTRGDYCCGSKSSKNTTISRSSVLILCFSSSHRCSDHSKCLRKRGGAPTWRRRVTDRVATLPLDLHTLSSFEINCAGTQLMSQSGIRFVRRARCIFVFSSMIDTECAAKVHASSIAVRKTYEKWAANNKHGYGFCYDFVSE